MYVFKCKDCGILQYGACKDVLPCCNCGGAISRVLDEKENERNHQKFLEKAKKRLDKFIASVL